MVEQEEQDPAVELFVVGFRGISMILSSSGRTFSRRFKSFVLEMA
jgi:hypothetical protein